MTVPTVCEPLDARRHCVISAGLDPAYAFAANALVKQVGANVSIYQAVPAAGDRTFILAERFEDRAENAFGESRGYLTIAAITADGRLDPAFGTGGVAKTGRLTQTHYVGQTSPGQLEVDDSRRIYFAADVRVLRFRPDGSTDTHFGRRGAMTFSDDSQPVALCDIAPVDGGVLIATTKTRKGVQYFGVLKAGGRRVRKTWLATHDMGIGFGDTDGTYLGPDDDDAVRHQLLASDKVQFTRSAGGVALVRLETDEESYYENYNADDDLSADGSTTYLTDGVIRQEAVVTRFDSAGHGTDVARAQVRRPGEHNSASLGAESQDFPLDSTVLTHTGRSLIMQTELQVLQFSLRTGEARQYDLPYDYQNYDNPRFRLLPDGNVWMYEQRYRYKPDGNIVVFTKIRRFALDGTLDTSIGEDGVYYVRKADFPERDNEHIEQIFQNASGRLQFLATGYTATGNTTLTLRRMATVL